MNTTSTRVSVTFSSYLKGKLEKASENLGCSQAEILRTAFIQFAEAEQ